MGTTKLPMQICTKNEATVLAKFGCKIYAEVDEQLKPRRYFTIEGESVRPVKVPDGVKGEGARKLNRGYAPNTVKLILTKVRPRLVQRDTILERVYIATRDLLAQKKYNNGVRRSVLETYLMDKLALKHPQVTSTISQLIYNKKALEVVK